MRKKMIVAGVFQILLALLIAASGSIQTAALERYGRKITIPVTSGYIADYYVNDENQTQTKYQMILDTGNIFNNRSSLQYLKSIGERSSIIYRESSTNRYGGTCFYVFENDEIGESVFYYFESETYFSDRSPFNMFIKNHEITAQITVMSNMVSFDGIYIDGIPVEEFFSV